MTFLRRLLYVLRSRRMEAEFAEELETHRLLAQQRELQGGAADAAAASRRAMGNVTLAREDARAQWIAPWLDSVWQDGTYALRGFRRAPAFTGAFVLVMALGVGATTAVFALVDSLVLRDLPVNRPDRLVYFSAPSFSYPIFTGVQARSTDVLGSVAAWSVEDEYVAWSQQLEPSEVLTASGGFYDTLGVTAVVGRTFSDADDRVGGGSEGRVAVISHSAWQRRYAGDPGVVGRTVRVGPDTYTIVGVTPRAFFGVAPGVAPEITIPLTSNARPSSLQSTTSSWVHLIGRLRDGVSLAEANTALQNFWPAVLESAVGAKVPANRRESFLGRQTSIESARAGFSRVRNRFARPLWFLFGLVVLLLVVAAASAANLLLARSAARRREIAVRLAIGAGRGRLVRQMLTESMVLTTIAAAAGLLFAKWGAGSLLALMTTREQVITLDAGISNRIVLFSLALAAITSALCSVIPAFRATGVDPACGLKAATGTLRTFGSGPASGRTIVAAQVAVSVLLLASATLFARSLYGVLSRTAGVDRQVLVVTADAEAGGYEDERAAPYYQQLLERVRNVPGVAAASISMYPPLSGGDGAWTQNVGIDGTAPGTDAASVVYFNTVSSGYFGTTGMTLLRGRDIADGDTPTAMPVAVVNEALVRRFFPGQDPIGRQITFGRDNSRQTLQIVGVVSDAKYQRLQEEPRSVAYLPWLQQRVENMFLELRAGSPAAVAEAVRREARRIDGVVPVHLQTVDERIRESLVTERVLATLAALLAGAAALLACAGLYGLLAYAVARQTREIGLRLALGAHPRAVTRKVLTDSMVLTAIGVVLGLGGALALGRFARGLVFQIAPADPVSIAAAAVLMLVVAALASVIPAWRAARIDPVVALKTE
jgi:putative ABC transport system permease protein